MPDWSPALMATAAASPEVSTSRTISRYWPEWLTLIAYGALLCWMIPYHEPWADEAQAWQLARSVSIPQLFHTYLRYEGSPGLWHLLLAVLARFHCTYQLMPWFAGAIATAGVALLIFHAPFPRYIRLTLPFTFYLCFQYAVVARSYVLVPVLVFCVAFCWKRHPALLAVALGLLGNVCLHSLAISGGFALTYLVLNYREARSRKFISAAAILVAFYLAAILTVWPLPHGLNFNPWSKIEHYSIGAKALAYIARTLMCWVAFLPNRHFSALLALLLAICSWIYFPMQLRKHGLLTYGLPVLTFSLFAGYYYNFWHAGMFILTVIAVCWIAWPKITQVGRVPLFLAILVIALQIGWTVHAAAFDHFQVYSPDFAAARFLKSHVDDGEAIALTYIRRPDINAYHSIGLAPYFDQPIFVNQRRAFWLWTSKEHTDAEFINDLKQKPPLVVAIYFNDDFTRFIPSRDLPHHPTADLLNRSGYRLTHYFCGEKPEKFSEREEICDLIYERRR
jgi:hypothetical protein